MDVEKKQRLLPLTLSQEGQWERDERRQRKDREKNPIRRRWVEINSDVMRGEQRTMSGKEEGGW